MLLRYRLVLLLLAGITKISAQVKVLPDTVKNTLRKTGQAMLDDLKPRLDINLLPHTTDRLKQEFHSLEATPLNQLQQLKSRIPVFDKGAFVTNSRVDSRIDYTYIDTAGNGMGLYGGRNQLVGYTLTYSASFGHLPFNITLRGNNNQYLVNRTALSDFYKLGFDQKKYLEDLQRAVAAKVKPDALTNAVQSRINTIKAAYEKKLQHEIAGIQQAYKQTYGTGLNLPADITNLSANDMTSLGNRLLTDTTLNKYKQSTDQLQELLKTRDAASLENDTLYHKLSGDAGQYDALKQVYSKIITSKQNFENNKVVTELKNNLSLPKGDYQDFLRNPANLQKVISEKMSLSGLQRLFINMTHLDIGQTALQSGDFSLQNVMNNGINTTFKNNKATVGFIYGKNSNTNYWLQSGLSSAVTNEYSTVTGFTFGNGSASAVQQSVSLNFFDFKNLSLADPAAPMQSSYMPVARHKDAALSYHTDFSIAGKHSFAIDLSKSLGSFSNNLTADSTPYKANAHGDVFKDAGLSNFAGAIDYTGELFNSDVRLFVKKTGLGYSNPGNAYLRRGETQAGFGFARRFYDRRLSVKYNIDYRTQKFDPAQNYRYNALNNKLQVGLRINHDSRVALSYQSIINTAHFYEQPAAAGHNNRWQGDGAYRVRLLRKKVLNNISLSWQQTDVPVPGAANYKSNALLFTHTSLVVLNKNILSLSLVANHSNNTDYYFNTSLFTVETNYSYALTNMVRLSSGAGYYANAGWNKQLGIKQQVSATLFNRMSLDVELGYKKAVQVIRTDLANQFFVTSMIHYAF